MSSKYEKNEKQTFEISIWVKKWLIYVFFQKVPACNKGSYFLLIKTKRCAKWTSLSN